LGAFYFSFEPNIFLNTSVPPQKNSIIRCCYQDDKSLILRFIDTSFFRIQNYSFDWSEDGSARLPILRV